MIIHEFTQIKPNWYSQDKEEYDRQLYNVLKELVLQDKFTMNQFIEFCEAKGITIF